jgi:hypothetical protein
MASVKYRPYWFKSNLCTLMSIDLEILNEMVSDECKKSVGWKEGIQKFRDYQVIEILQDLFRAKTLDEIRQMIGYNPQYSLNFPEKPLNS